MRAHVIVTEDLINSIDKLVGPRHRSQFFAEAAAEKLIKVKRTKIAKKLAGSLAKNKITGWETSKKAAEWVRNSRTLDEEKLKHALSRSNG